MIKAALHGKLPELECMEDALTSTVFGRLRYLPPEDVLVPFLEKAVCYSQDRITLKQYLYMHGINLAMYKNVSYYFWTHNQIYGEPDLVLIFNGLSSCIKDLLLLVEAKYKYSKSGTGENDQLMRYYLAINQQINYFRQEAIADFSGIIGPIIYLTELEAATEIGESEEAIKNRVEKELKHPIFHLHWQKLYSVLEGTQINEQYKTVIVQDLLSYLDLTNLREFTGITPPSPNILGIVHSNLPLFFAGPITVTETTGYFQGLPNLNISLEKYCFYRG